MKYVSYLKIQHIDTDHTLNPNLLILKGFLSVTNVPNVNGKIGLPDQPFA